MNNNTELTYYLEINMIIKNYGRFWYVFDMDVWNNNIWFCIEKARLKSQIEKNIDFFYIK